MKSRRQRGCLSKTENQNGQAGNSTGGTHFDGSAEVTLPYATAEDEDGHASSVPHESAALLFARGRFLFCGLLFCRFLLGGRFGFARRAAEDVIPAGRVFDV